MAQEIETTPRTTRNRVVHHWARVWLGKPITVDSRTRIHWEEQAGEVEVSVQEYGDPRWIEKLMADIIDVSQEFLLDAPEGFDSVRVRVMLYTHQTDGRNQKFTLEHIERPPTN